MYGETDTLLQVTKDGSHTLYSKKFNETYHSQHGALAESQHVFIKNGLFLQWDESEISTLVVLELGMGTALNAVLTWLEAAQHKKLVHYIGLEKYPLEEKVANELNFQLDAEQNQWIKDLHKLPWGTQCNLNPYFDFIKHEIYFEDFSVDSSIDLIYHDAFAPSVQPEFWEPLFLAKCYSWLKEGGSLTTYCAKGSFKRALKEVGFLVDTLPGAPGKREMTRAIKPFTQKWHV